MLGIFWNISYNRNEFFVFFVYNSKENKYMGSLSKLFWAAIDKGVRDIDIATTKDHAPKKRKRQ